MKSFENLFNFNSKKYFIIKNYINLTLLIYLNKTGNNLSFNKNIKRPSITKIFLFIKPIEPLLENLNYYCMDQNNKLQYK